MKHLLASCVGLLVSLFLCTFAVGHGDIDSWTEGQRVLTSLLMGGAFTIPLLLGYLNGEL